MRTLSTKDVSHRLLASFVDWIRPEESTIAHIEKQADEIRELIKAWAAADGLTIQSTPWSGSFKKKTGLRRLRRDGQNVVEGQDVDLPFVVSPRTNDGREIKTLLDKFERYAKAAYPSSECTRTKSSVCLNFKSTKLAYDLVPMLAVPGNDRAQILLRADGEQRQTSVQKHIEFITERNGTSNALGVQFNDCVRLMKWRRDLRQSQNSALREVPTFLLDLLCAHAYDHCKVEKTFPDTLRTWFAHLGQVVRTRELIRFPSSKNRMASPNGVWEVIDPVYSDNNVALGWKEAQINELAAWFDNAHKSMQEVIGADIAGNEAMVRDKLVGLFGEPMKSMK